MPRLVVEKGKDKGKVLTLRENSPYLVGRDLKTHLRLRDEQVSRRHLKITYKLGEVRLEDLDSSNGTFVNGERIRSVELKAGDKIQVGDTLVFYLDDESVDDVGLPAAGSGSGPAVVVQTQPPERVRRAELTDRELAGYRIGRLLGRGGMGTVYEAMQVSLERRVAFKVLARELAADGQFVDRFTAEARAAGQLNHPNIVQVYDVGMASLPGGSGGGSPPEWVRFYSMEFMPGGSVEDLLRKEGRLTVERALAVTFDAARGLEYAERHGVVHRDIKPDNLMMSDDGVVKIGDLGIATRRRAEGEASKEEGVSGSPHYMAPEQAMGRAIDHRADLYALGVSLYQMLSGDTPFEGSSAREVILKHLNEQPPPLAAKMPSLPVEVVALVERLMEKDPTRRLASASILLQELVPLVRRFPLDTSRLRIDGIIAQRTELQLAATTSGDGRGSGKSARLPLPDTQPRTLPPLGLADAKSETAVLEAQRPQQRRAPVSRAALVRAVLVLGSLALGVLAFSVVRHFREGASARRETRLKQLRDVRDLVAKDPAAGEKAAKALAISFDKDGFHDEEREASRLAKDAGELLAVAEEKKHAEAAAQAFRDALKDIEAKKDVATDPEKIGWIELQVKLYGDIAEKFAGTAEGNRAANEREVAHSRLEDAKKKRAARLAQEASTRADLIAIQESLRMEYREGRFDNAKVLIDNFDQKHGTTELGAKSVPRLMEELLEKGRAVLDTVRQKSADHASRKEWDKARTVLQDARLKVKGVTALEGEIDADLRALLDKEQRGRADELARQDAERRTAAEDAAKPLIDDRRFEEAAVKFEEGALKIRGSPLIQKDLERRAERLRLAAAAIKDIVSAVQEKHRSSGVTHDGAAAEDATGSKVQFRGAAGHVEVTFAQVPAAELHRWARQAAGPKPDPDAVIHAAALALELGAKDLAQTDVASASDLTLTKSQQEKLETLRAWLSE